MKLLRSYLSRHKKPKRRPLRADVTALRLAAHQPDAADIFSDDGPPSLCDGDSSDEEGNDERMVSTTVAMRSRWTRAEEEPRPTRASLTPDPSLSNVLKRTAGQRRPTVLFDIGALQQERPGNSYDARTSGQFLVLVRQETFQQPGRYVLFVKRTHNDSLQASAPLFGSLEYRFHVQSCNGVQLH